MITVKMIVRRVGRMARFILNAPLFYKCLYRFMISETQRCCAFTIYHFKIIISWIDPSTTLGMTGMVSFHDLWDAAVLRLYQIVFQFHDSWDVAVLRLYNISFQNHHLMNRSLDYARDDRHGIVSISWDAINRVSTSSLWTINEHVREGLDPPLPTGDSRVAPT